MASYQELQETIIKGQKEKTREVVSALLDGGEAPMEIIQEGLIGAMSVVGEKWKAGELFIPEVIASADAMNKGMNILKPLIVGDESASFYTGKVAIGTVQGDIHNIGKNIVAMLLESGGFEVIDLGVDVPAGKFVEAVRQEQPDILGLSALITTTMPRMKDVVEALTAAKVRDKVRILVGGAPVTQDFANSIGADGYAPDGPSAVDKAKQLLG